MNKIIGGIILSAMLLCMLSCSSGATIKAYSRESVNLDYIKTVVVLPFEGADTLRVREFALTQMLTSGRFDVVDKARVDIALSRELIAPGAPIDNRTLLKLGKQLKAEAFLFGSVDQLQQSRGNARFSEIIMTLRLIDSETGTLLWQASGRGSGYSLLDRLFGMAPKDDFSVAMGLLKELIETIY